MIDVTEKSRRIVILISRILLVGIIIFGSYHRNPTVIANGFFSFLLTFLPAILKRDYKIPLGPGSAIGLTLAVLLHAIGTLGPYDSIIWWDDVMHGFTTAIVVLIGYIAVRSVDIHRDDIHLPPRFMFVFVLIFTMAAGVLWELFEFSVAEAVKIMNIDAPLIQYGLDDSILDLVYDMVGGILIAIYGHIYYNEIGLAREHV